MNYQRFVLCGYGLVGLLGNLNLAVSKTCDCNIKQGSCTVTSATFNKNVITFKIGTLKCANFNWHDGDNQSDNVTATDGSLDVDYTPTDPKRKPNITTDSCTVCKTTE